MVETRRSDEPLVETVEPEALARRGRAHAAAGSGEVPARGRKASPRRAAPAQLARHPSLFERMLAQNEMSYYSLMAVRQPMRVRAADNRCARRDATYFWRAWARRGAYPCAFRA
jgi:hypothetical protein